MRMITISESKLRHTIRTEYMKMMIESMKLNQSLDEDKNLVVDKQRAKALARAAKAALALGDKERAAQLYQAAKTLMGK